MSVSKSRVMVLLMIMAVFAAACGGAATPTRPPATSVPAEPTTEAEESTEEATIEAAEPTEEVTEVAVEPTMEATEEATVEVAGADETEEAVAEETVEATEVAIEPTLETTEEATVEATEENVIEVTLEVTDEATLEATEESTVEATVEATEEADEMVSVTVQLQGEAQAGYAPFYVADEQGYYEDEGLDVTWAGESDEIPLADDATFGVADAYDVLAAIEGGDDVVVIGFLPSGMADMSIPAEMTVEAEATVDAEATADPIVDVAMGAVGSGYLVIYTSDAWLSEDGSEETAVDFLRATLMGWSYCAENGDECLEIVGEFVPAVVESDLMLIQATAGMSAADLSMSIETQWDAIVGGALAPDIITEKPSEDAVRLDLFIEALESISEMDSGMDSTSEMEVTAEATETMGGMTEATAEATP